MTFKIFPATLTHDNRKVPIKELNGWKDKATVDQNVIAEWSRLYGHKIKLWAMPTGSINGILVLDVDVKDGGLETIKKYHVPVTMSQRTMSGGMHYIFKYPNDGNIYGNRVKFDEGLDIRGEGGYIAYYGMDNTPIADAPEWLLEQSLSDKNLMPVELDDIISVSPEIVEMALEKACENIRNAPQGESNNVLNTEAFKIGQFLPSQSINREHAYNELFKAAKDRGKPDYEAKATIESGFKGGGQQAHTSPFGNDAPELTIPEHETPEKERWTPRFFTRSNLTDYSKLKKPQLFKDWSTEDIHITTADGGTGKTTLKLVEAISLALGENFLGFENVQQGRTLFITGEDTAEKLGAMLGAILKQMGILDDHAKVKQVMNNVLVKKDADLCLIDKTRQGFINPNYEALDRVMQAVEDLRPKMIVFDPISSFWGSEAALNDMSKAVSKFMARLVQESDACVEMINHMGKQSSNNKDMSQFAGRGGTGLPSHARVSRVLRPIFEEEYEELTGMVLSEDQSAMMCNVNKFSDGSPLYNKPFLIVREGFVFSRVVLQERQVKEEQQKMSDNERIFIFIKEERNNKRYPSKDVIVAHFMASSEKISKDRVSRALSMLSYTGHMGEKIKQIDNPDVEAGGKTFIVTDMEGKE